MVSAPQVSPEQARAIVRWIMSLRAVAAQAGRRPCMSHRVTIRYCDGTERAMQVAAGQTVLDAADANAVPIVSECQSGVCGTCVGRCTAGLVLARTAMGLSQQEKEQGRVLTCQTFVRSDCVIEVDYPFDSNAARMVTGEAARGAGGASWLRRALLTLDVSELPERLDFKAGQFAQLKVPGSDQWRSYSFAHAPRADSQVEFLIRLLPQGAMSDYLRERACLAIGCRFAAAKAASICAPLRDGSLLIAGGTGLSAVLAIAEQLALERSSRPVELIYGVTTEADLVLTSRLAELASRNRWFQLALHRPEAISAVAWRCRRGDRSARRRAARRRRSGYLRVRAAADDRCHPTVAALARTAATRTSTTRNSWPSGVARRCSAAPSACAEPLDISSLRREGTRHSGGHRRLDRRHGDREGAHQHLRPRASCWRRIRTTGAVKAVRAPRKAGTCITC